LGDLEFFGKKDKPGVRGLPDNGVRRIIPGENSLLIGGKEHPRRKIPSHRDNITPAIFRIWKVVPVTFGKIGKIGIRA
jgi:hypothetical protein